MNIKRIICILVSAFPAVSYAAGLPEIASSADTLFFDDGAWYLGEIADSMFNGYGKMVYADSTVYEGQWKDGLWDGKGMVRYPDGDSYSGEFRNHLMDGDGIYLFSNGDKYDGRWSEGRFNGVGSYTFADGSTYTGMWENDMKEGLGILYSAQENAVFKGYFHEDSYMGTSQSTDPEAGAVPDTDILDDDDVGEKILLGTSFGTGLAMGFQIMIETEKAFGGISLGFNTRSYTKGEAAEYTDEDGNYHKLVDWNQDPADVYLEGIYPAFYIGADYGRTWKRFSLGAMAGVGVEMAYRNCKAMTDRVFPVSTFYYKTTFEKAFFAWRAYTRYNISSFDLKSDWDGIRTLDLIISAGYGNVDGIFFGFGMRF